MVSSVRSAPGRRISVAQVLGLLLAFVLMSGLGGVLAAGLVMPVVGATSTVTSTSVRLFDDLPDELAQVALSEKSVMLASDGTVLAEFYDQNRIVVPLDQVSQSMKDAVIAIEDHRFYEHGAIDPQGMLRALVRNTTCDDCNTQGGSTLTQQYVKNALVQAAIESSATDAERAAAIEAATTSDGTEGIARKLSEAKMAIALEQRWTKDQILEAYLNIAQFGLSVYGVEAAAQFYFSVPASQLNYLQAATIAGVTRGPSIYDPTRNPVKSQERRNLVLQRMNTLGMITDEEYQAGIATPIEATLVLGTPRFTCQAANAIGGAGYFCDYVTKIIATNPVFGESQQDRKDLLYRGGLTITTTINPWLQTIADAEIKAGIPVDDPSGVAHAISIVQPGTGQVLAMAQNRVYNPRQSAVPYETAVNYNTDNLYGSASGFPPGSTFKPFTLLQWFKDGHGLGEVVNGTQRRRNENEFTQCGARLPNKPWELGNAEGGRGIMTVLDATRNSVNNGYADMAAQLDLCEIMTGAAEIGVHRAGGLAGEGPFDPIPSNVIGTQSIAPLAMANAFATFASGGIYCDPIAILSVVDREGNQLPVPQANCAQRIDPGIAAAMNYTLSQVWTGTGRPIGALPNQPAAGKTGTTTNNEHTWFVGYTPYFSAAVWVGFSEGMIPVQRMTINGRYYRNVYGSSIAGPTWRRIMVQAHAGAQVLRFADPPGQYISGMQAQVPSVRGRSVDEATRILREAGFNVTVSQSGVWSDAPFGSVAETSPGAGSRVTRGTQVTIFISSGPEPKPEPTPPPQGNNGGNNGGGTGGPRPGPDNPGGG